MLRHVCVVLLALILTLNFGGLLVQEAEASDHGWGNRQLLELFEYQGAGLHQENFQLPFDAGDFDSHDYERYVFELYAHQPLGGGSTSVFYVQVNNLGTNDVMCRGVLGDFFGFNAHLYCDDLLSGHIYTITIIATLPADLTLSGVNPI